jgi:glycosyltransferase involved in cell wall biosynthesis
MMHVAHLETGRHLYGGAGQVLYLLEGLATAGIRSTLICPPGSEIYTAANQAHHTVVPMGTAGDLDPALGLRLTSWLNSAEPDLLHVHSRRGADYWGGLAARRVNIPAILSRRVDNPDVPVLGMLKYRLYRRVIAISGQIATQLRAAGLHDEQLRVVHSAIKPPTSSPAWTREQFLQAFNLEAQHLAVVCVAQFIARKGHAFLLDAWPEVLRACPDARLLLFGQGDGLQSIRTQAEREGIAHSLRFAGFRADLPDFLAHADLLVHPALREGLGICLLEAQAAGVPVVASRVGGIPEAVADGESGVLVAPGQPAELAAALVNLLDDAALREALGKGGRAQVAEHFSAGSMVSGNLAVYRELLGDGVV